MESVMSACTLKSKRLTDHLKNHLDQTLGQRAEAPAEVATHNNEVAHFSLEATTLAIEALRTQVSVQQQAPSSDKVHQLYYKGASDMLLLQQETTSDEIVYSRFSDIQKGTLCDFCMVTSWKDVPVI